VSKKQKESSEVRDSNLVDCGTLSTGERDFPEEIIPYIIRN